MSLLSIVSPTPLDPALDAFLHLVAPTAGSPLGKGRREADVLRQKMASAGHDLRQPLQVIGYALSRLGRNLANDRDRAWLEAAVSQTQRLADGLTDLVDAARDASGATDIETVDLGGLMDGAARDWCFYAAERGVDLRILRTTGHVRSHRKRLKAVVDNLVGNAIKYAPEGRVRVGVRRRLGALVLVVIDDGIGIGPADQERIFDAFEQVDSAREGVGLGLSLVAEHCHALGHVLRLSSRPGRGSCFSVDLGRDSPGES